ncbi:hypothetical protein OROMI_002445 [Orobanche minor]
MVTTTRSMSISGTKTAVNDKAAQRETARYQRGITGKCTTSSCWTVMDDAHCLFGEEYKEKNREKYPPTSTGAIISLEFAEAIRQAWRVMSSKDKAPYVEIAKKMRAEGLTKRV